MKAKISRNDPCPCGSGKKFKKCCALKTNPAKKNQNTNELLNSAVQLHQNGDIKQAKNLYRSVLKIDPNNDNALNLLGVIAHKEGDLDTAVNLISRAIKLDPNAPEFHYNLAKVMQDNGDIKTSISHYQRALDINPAIADAHINIGLLFFENHQFEEAKAHYSQALKLEPNSIEAHNNLAAALMKLGNYEDAVTLYKKSLSIYPNFAAQMELGNAFYNLGEPEKAILNFQRSLDLASESERAAAFSNMLLMLNYSLNYSPKEVYEEHLKFSKEFSKPLAQHIPAHSNDPEASRKLRVGYVSGDFRKHSVAYFISPILEHHDSDQIEAYCYYNNKVNDELTGQLKSYCHQWREIAHMNDEEVVKLIQKDKIDILVDLSGHTADDRLLMFARKPAPVQVSWIGYPNTTGLSAMDYRITDSYADPVGEIDQYYSEQLIRLPECFSCYSPPKKSPDVSPPPSSETGHVTFGTFNKLAKITPEAIRIWSQILLKLPNSKLLLKTAALREESIKNSLLKTFISNGVNPSNIIFLEKDASQFEHLKKYDNIDIALDTFPYNGTTTTCEALWMGVPVVVMEGNSHVSRVGVSQLNNIGLKDLIAESSEDYVRIAIELSKNSDKLIDLRKNLRAKMKNSPLMKADNLTKNLEKEFRSMWRNWCFKKNQSGE